MNQRLTGLAPTSLDSSLLWRETGLAAGSAFVMYLALRLQQPWIAYGAAALSLWAWSMTRRHYRHIADIPTARIISAPQGYIELTGEGDLLPEYPIVSPLTGLPCLWYEYRVERVEGRERELLRSGVSELPFVLSDGSGRVLVETVDARVISWHSQQWQRGDEHVTETVLLKHEALYVLGEHVHPSVEAGSSALDKERNAILSEWKSDQSSLLERFDTDRNGRIDSQEWENARQAAQQKAMSSVETVARRDAIIRKPPHNQPFLISNYSAKELAGRFRRWSWLHLGIFFAALVLATW
ncbi:MAG: hypothetical protein RIQ43_935 [Pseudomonadota bacterium]